MSVASLAHMCGQDEIQCAATPIPPSPAFLWLCGSRWDTEQEDVEMTVGHGN